MKTPLNILLTTALLLGPASAQSATNPVKGNANLKAEITVLSTVDDKTNVIAFNKLYPNVKVNIITAPVADFITKINTSAAVNSFLADVLQMPDAAIAPIVASYPTYLADLSKVATKYKSSFTTNAWNTRNPGGKVVAMPVDNTSMVLYYRADLFKKAGIDPSKLTTWTDFAAAGKKFQAAVPGTKFLAEDFTGTGGNVNLLTVLSQERNTGYFNAKGEITLNSPEMVRAMTTVKSFKDAGILQNVQGIDGFLGAMKTDKFAAVLYPAWLASLLKVFVPEQKGKWGVMVPPGYSAQGSHAATSTGSGYSISRNTKNFDAAWAYVEFVSTQAALQIAKASGTPFIPAYLPALKTLSNFADPFFATPKYIVPVLAVSKSIPSVTLNINSQNAANAAGNAYSAVLNTGVDPKVALDKAAQDLANQTGLKIAPK